MTGLELLESCLRCEEQQDKNVFQEKLEDGNETGKVTRGSVLQRSIALGYVGYGVEERSREVEVMHPPQPLNQRLKFSDSPHFFLTFIVCKTLEMNVNLTKEVAI